MSARPVPVAIVLLSMSNIFMTFAGYAHLKSLSHRPWFVAALVSRLDSPDAALLYWLLVSPGEARQ